MGSVRARDIGGSPRALVARGAITLWIDEIQPADYIRAFAAGLGAKIGLYENSAVVEFTRRGKAWTARMARGSVTVPKVILGVNGLVKASGHFAAV